MSWIHRIASRRPRRQAALLPRLRHPTAGSADHQARPCRRRRSCPGRHGPDAERAGGPGSTPARRSPKFPTRLIPSPRRKEARLSRRGRDPDGGAVGRVRAAGSASCRVLWARSAGAAGGPGRRTAERRWILRPPPAARAPALALPRIGAIVATRHGHHGAGRARVHPRPADPHGQRRRWHHPSSTDSPRRVRCRRHAGARPDPAAGHLSDSDRLLRGHRGGRGGHRRPHPDRCPLQWPRGTANSPCATKPPSPSPA